jgi:endonuclease/exonuclease/phosphatase family metal-dependent hydrolase
MQNIVIAGDFNSNTIWDEWDRWWNHSDVVRELAKIGIKSVYHELNQLEHGKETIPTLFHRKNKDTSYHIDYVFVSDEIMKKVILFQIENFENWLDVSDHVPLIIEIE